MTVEGYSSSGGVMQSGAYTMIMSAGSPVPAGQSSAGSWTLLSGLITTDPAGTVGVSGPFAGMVWTIGTTQAVTWTAPSLTGTVNIKLSIDGGSTYPISLATNTANDGIDSITVPNNPSTACRVKVESSSDGTVFGLNPGDFTIAAPAPAAPVASAATGVTSSGFTANWSSVAGATGYRLDVATDNGFTSLLVAYNNKDVGNATNEQVTGLNANTSYFYRIRACNIGGTSGNSATTTVLTAPIAPIANVPSSVSSSSFAANWSISPGALGYRLDVAADSLFATILSAYSNKDVGDVTTSTVAGLSSTTSYYYRVRAYNSGGASENSNTMVVQTPVGPSVVVVAPAAGVNWNVGSQQTVTWTSQNMASNVNIVLSIDGGSTWPVNLVSNTADDGTEPVTVPNSPSITCRIKVESASDGTVYGMNPGDFTIVDPAPPTISTPSIVGGSAGQSLLVIAVITDNTGVTSATMYYRRSGDQTFTSIAMTASGGSFQGTVPASAVTSSGVDYYLKATDSQGNTARYPSNGWTSVQVIVSGTGLVSGSAQPGGSEQTAYRLVSIPLQADNNSVASILPDNLGTYNNAQWRLFEMKADQSYAEYPNVSAWTPGKAFWLIVKDAGKVIDTGPGKSVSTATPYPVSLHAQWNLVGNPYAFTLPVDKLSLANSAAVTLRSYDGSWNNTISSPVTTMEPFKGYALFTSSATTLNVNGDLSTGALPKTLIPSNGWWLTIEGRCGDARDIDNVAMVAEGSNVAHDLLDVPEPPPIGNYVSVRFPHPEWGEDANAYCVDARPRVDEKEVWQFEVRTATRDRVRLTFAGMERVPSEYQIWLVDEAVHVLHDLRTQPWYEIAGPGEGQSRRFDLVVGKAAAVEKLKATWMIVPSSYQLSQNFPNPFNPITTIGYALPVTSYVTLRVYNLLGREVATSVDRVEPAGHRSVVFDGSMMATGVYYYVLSATAVDGTTEGFSATKRLTVLK